MLKLIFRNLIAGVPLLLLVFFASSQELYKYNLYAVNSHLLNPANALNNNYMSFMAGSHMQWMGVEGSPRVYDFRSSYRYSQSMGLGISFSNASMGLYNITNASVQYGYGVKLTENDWLRLGLSVGYMNDAFVRSRILGDPGADPLLAGNLTKSFVTAGFGAIYSFEEYEFQLALPHLYYRNSFGGDAYLFASYKYAYNDDLLIKPSVLAAMDMQQSFFADLNVMALWRNQFWAQLAYRTDNSIISSIGIIINSYSLGYSFQVVRTKLSNSYLGTHEVNFGYVMPEKIEVIRKQVVNGQVKSSVNSKPVKASVEVFYNNKPVQAVNTDDNGFFSVELKANRDYTFKLHAEGYKPIVESVTTNSSTRTLPFSSSLIPTTISIKGKVTDRLSGKPINADIFIKQDGRVVAKAVSEAGNGFVAEIKRDSIPLEIIYNANGFESRTENLTYDYLAETVKANVELNPIIKVEGVVTDQKTGKPIGARLTLSDAKTGEAIREIVASSSDGHYEIKLPRQTSIAIAANATGYMFYNDTVQWYGNNYSIKHDFSMRPLTKGVSVVLKNVVFEQGSTELLESSKPELDNIAQVMLDNPTIKIEISGHTDNVGSYAANKSLSQKRAQAAVDYLISKGVDGSRLKAVGYGPDKPRASNDTEEGRMLNRRVEAAVINE
ncbi:PorP/SprF family type IX secretion system membrane protein [Tenuifilum thalassicum]|uniref:Type IX secretion system membrane protein PorP/SprF n=1 Tax=Tenuifilum thalassicum TaxID=2590900 RepID=A0A7D4C7M7_9BACT|nr:PorP/SprF family type IX secretion system membrane protein [Tenuifilum thalassicum]QKG79122.1 type IX secretion system membrane protein PorP/SprF [Tenuifilum thalassicum]